MRMPPFEDEGSDMDVFQEEMLSIDALLLARGYLYRLFGKFFGGEPSRQALEVLSGATTLEALGSYADENQEMRHLREYLAEIASTIDDDATERAASEFTRAFVGPVVLPALPWGAPYESGDPVMFQKGTLAVREAYRKHGVQPAHFQHVPDDHLALECNFMALLSAELLNSFESSKWDQARDAIIEQKTFLDQFMVGWVPSYAQKLSASRKAPFYARLAAGAGAFILLDSIFLGEALQWIEDAQSESLLGWDETAANISGTFPLLREGLASASALEFKFADEYELSVLS